MDYDQASASALQPGDILVRRKTSGLGDHFGTWLSMGVVAHTTPEYGKHLGTFKEFAGGKTVQVIRPQRTLDEALLSEFRAIEDLGTPYHLTAANCEQDVTRVHEGTARSPSVGLCLVGLALGGLAWVVTRKN